MFVTQEAKDGESVVEKHTGNDGERERAVERDGEETFVLSDCLLFFFFFFFFFFSFCSRSSFAASARSLARCKQQKAAEMRKLFSRRSEQRGFSLFACLLARAREGGERFLITLFETERERNVSSPSSERRAIASAGERAQRRRKEATRLSPQRLRQ